MYHQYDGYIFPVQVGSAPLLGVERPDTTLLSRRARRRGPRSTHSLLRRRSAWRASKCLSFASEQLPDPSCKNTSASLSPPLSCCPSSPSLSASSCLSSCLGSLDASGNRVVKFKNPRSIFAFEQRINRWHDRPSINVSSSSVLPAPERCQPALDEARLAEHRANSSDTNAFTFLLVNARSLKPKIEELLVRLETLKPMFVGVCESWLDGSTKNLLLKGYIQISRRDHSENANRGGIILFARLHYNCIGHISNSSTAERSWHTYSSL